MSDELQRLLDRARAPGEFVERRRFTLSREKAIEKQRAFALRDPQRYILELVQSAAHAQASFIAVDVRYEHLTMAFVGGRTLRVRELEQLFDYLFVDRGDAETRHLIQLAVGLNALLRLRPLSVRVESGAGDTAARMDINARREVSVGEPLEPIAGTYVYAQLRGSWLRRFSDVKVFAEQALIEERCVYTSVPILVNGAAPFGYSSTRRLNAFPGHHQLPFDTDLRHGELALPRKPGISPGFKVVMGGTWITTLQLPELGEVRMKDGLGRWVQQPFFGVICDDTLRKTADQSDVVRDRRFTAMLRALRPLARALAARLQPDVEYLGAADDEAVTLPARVPVLGQPEPLPMSALAALPSPLLWASPEDAPHIAEVADPAALRARVLVLREAEAEDLARTRPELTLRRLSHGADVDLARLRLEREHRPVAVDVETRLGSLCLMFHGEAPRPGWGFGPGVPALMREGGVTKSTARLQGRALPGVSAMLSVDQGVPLPQPADLAGLVQWEAWRLVEAAPWAHPVTQALALTLVDLHARPEVVEEGGARRLALHTPPDWPQDLRARVLSMPQLAPEALLAAAEARSRGDEPPEGYEALERLLEGLTDDPWVAPSPALSPPLVGAWDDDPGHGAPLLALLRHPELPLRDGAPPEVYLSLLHSPEAPTWLCTKEVKLPSLRGRIGLRSAAHAQQSLFIWTPSWPSRRLPVLGGLPALGLLSVTEGRPRRGDVVTLGLLMLELYAELLPLLEAGPAAAAPSAATPSAATPAVAAQHAATMYAERFIEHFGLGTPLAQAFKARLPGRRPASSAARLPAAASRPFEPAQLVDRVRSALASLLPDEPTLSVGAGHPELLLPAGLFRPFAVSTAPDEQGLGLRTVVTPRWNHPVMMAAQRDPRALHMVEMDIARRVVEVASEANMFHVELSAVLSQLMVLQLLSAGVPRGTPIEEEPERDE